jgi:hypothetical protein
MTNTDKIQVGDIGTAFTVIVTDNDIPVNISSCTTKHIIFKKPSGETVVKDADFYTDGSDGYIQYVATSGDIDQTGLWKIQGYIEAAGLSWHTYQGNFLVMDNLEA